MRVIYHGGIFRDGLPLRLAELEGRQHLERHIRHDRPLTGLEGLELLHDGR